MAVLSTSQAPGRNRRRSMDVRNVPKGLLFISPWLFGFLAFTVYPIIASFYYSFTRYDIISSPRWIGLANYSQLLFDDDEFRTVLFNTLWFVVIAVPIGVSVAFLLPTL